VSRPRPSRAQAPPLAFKAKVTRVVLGFVSIYVVYWLLKMALGVTIAMKVAQCMEQAPKGKAATEAEARARGEAFFACVEGRLNVVERLFYERTYVQVDGTTRGAR
jgi:hypothetical protein